MIITKIEEGRMKKLGDDSYVVRKTYRVSLICAKEPRTITIPVGYTSNGSNCSPDIGYGWLFHDWLYYRKCFDDGTECSRAKADKILEKISILIGEPIYGKVAGAILKLDPFGLATEAWN